MPPVPRDSLLDQSREDLSQHNSPIAIRSDDGPAEEEPVSQAPPKIVRKTDNTKAIIIYNFAIFCSGLGMLISKALYTRHPALTASQILTVRGVLSTLVAAGLTGDQLRNALWDGIPQGCGVKVAKRSLQASFNVWLQFSLTRVLSLVFVSLSQNMTPWVTAVWSYFWIGERLKAKDFILICTTFVGVTLITLGFAEDKSSNDKPNFYAVIACVLVPILLAYAAILMSTMKGLHKNTVALYLNPTLTFFMIMDQFIQQDSPYVFTQLTTIDYLLLLVFGVNAFAVQTLKYLALQYQEPAKLSHYQYMNSVYQLMYDCFLFHATFSSLQWWGLVVMIASYVTVGGMAVYFQSRDDNLKKQLEEEQSKQNKFKEIEEIELNNGKNKLN